jgi:Tfp pilus assembly protein PilO
MNRLSPAKRNQLIMVILATTAVIAMVFMFLIAPEKQQIERQSKEIVKQRKQLEEMRETIKKAAEMAAAFAAVSNQLALAEADVASGDIYAWTYDTIRRFKAPYRLEIPGMGQPSAGDVDLLPGVSYRQVKLTLNGTGYYHDLGKFVADFENTFPHMRLVNLGLEPSPAVNAPERLAFHFDVIALVKPNN